MDAHFCDTVKKKTKTYKKGGEKSRVFYENRLYQEERPLVKK